MARYTVNFTFTFYTLFPLHAQQVRINYVSSDLANEVTLLCLLFCHPTPSKKCTELFMVSGLVLFCWKKPHTVFLHTFVNSWSHKRIVPIILVAHSATPPPHTHTHTLLTICNGTLWINMETLFWESRSTKSIASVAAEQNEWRVSSSIMSLKNIPTYTIQSYFTICIVLIWMQMQQFCCISCW